MLILLINLDRSTERLASAKAQFDKVGWRFERVTAIVPDVVDSHPEFDPKRFRWLHRRMIQKGELGCALSHKRCLEKFLSTDEDHCIVFEDDICFDEQTRPTIQEALKWLDAHPDINWQCINLSSAYAKRYKDLTMIEGRKLRRSWQFPMLASALLWNRRGAAAFLSYLKQQLIFAPVDNQLRYLLARTGQGMSFDIPPVGLTYVKSDIGSDRVADGGTKNDWRNLQRRVPVYGWALWNSLWR
ncbi:glycosyltransferase family 25 protein [Pseudotabrizicola sediminis]|uniref:glycosyltransferase family 25 protein n=1 Tax=Pseudotabrizicola sediminis TaxID=2486418 RepID=UPI0014369A4B|nr:glycosyltransferase family 25 protein [Pseudotabrizicola sediminis]